MKNGKISENILRRSVLKNIGKNNDVSVLGDVVTVAQTIVDKYNQLEITAVRTLYRCFNRLWADGIIPCGIQIALSLSDRVSEKKLADTIREIDAICAIEGVVILGGHTEVSSDISRSVVSITAIGKGSKDSFSRVDCKMNPGVVLTKWVCLDATVSYAHANRDQLSQRLPDWLIDEAESFSRYLSVREDAKLARDNGALYLKPLGARGIFGGLWELGQALDAGMEIGLRDIPIRQETVEICELLDVNPYEVDSCGALLVVTDDAVNLVEKYKEAGILATIIGNLNSTNDRVLVSGEERRFIDKS